MNDKETIKKLSETELELDTVRRSNEDYKVTINEFHETLGLFSHAHSLNRKAIDSHHEIHKEVHKATE